MVKGVPEVRIHAKCSRRYLERMTVRDMLTALQMLPRDAELLAFEAGGEDNCEREVDEVNGRAAGCTCTWVSAGTTGREARRWGRCPSPTAASSDRSEPKVARMR
jgi:hypothetical protein